MHMPKVFAIFKVTFNRKIAKWTVGRNKPLGIPCTAEVIMLFSQENVSDEFRYQKGWML